MNFNGRLIGLTGIAGSGKDTAADILVRLGWVNIALADPMKRAVKEWFGFTDEQLWGPSEKRNAPDKRYPLPPKPFHGEIIDKTKPKTTWSREFPGPVKRTVSITGVPVTDEFMEFMARLVEERMFLTPRHALQQLGTEYGRACYEDVWIDYALRIAGLLLRDGEPFPFAYDPRVGARTSEGPPARGVVISDVRFPNEAAAIQAAGGRIVAIAGRGGLAGDAAAHASESGIPPELIDVVIDNSGTLEALTMAVERLVM